MRQEDILMLMKRYDKDEDSRLSFEEFSKMVLPIKKGSCGKTKSQKIVRQKSMDALKTPRMKNNSRVVSTAASTGLRRSA